MEPMGSRGPPGQGQPPAGSESCVARRVDPGLRSVDSERESLVLSLEMQCSWVPKLSRKWKATPTRWTPLAAKGSARRTHRGRRPGRARKGSAGTWEAPSPPHGGPSRSGGRGTAERRQRSEGGGGGG